MNLSIRYNPDENLTATTAIYNSKDVLLLAISDETLRSNNKLCRALDALIDLGTGGPRGSTLVEESSKTHTMIRNLQQLMEKKKRKANA